MKKSQIIFLGIVLFQIIILFFIIGNYEYLKNTGTTVYIKTTGYDPVDFFRGNYVQIAYELPISEEQSKSVETFSYSKKKYIVPLIDKNKIIGVEDISTEKPNNSLYLTTDDLWIQTKREYIIIGEDKQKYTYNEFWCENDKMPVNTDVIFEKDIDSGQVNYVYQEENGVEKTPFYGQRIRGKILERGDCKKYLRITNSSVNKYFVQEGTGESIEKKIRNGDMYAQWKMHANGKIILVDLIPEALLP